MPNGPLDVFTALVCCYHLPVWHKCASILLKLKCIKNLWINHHVGYKMSNKFQFHQVLTLTVMLQHWKVKSYLVLLARKISSNTLPSNTAPGCLCEFEHFVLVFTVLSIKCCFSSFHCTLNWFTTVDCWEKQPWLQPFLVQSQERVALRAQYWAVFHVVENRL